MMNSFPLQNPEHILSRFFLCGISHLKTDAATRSLFHINDVEKEIILNTAKALGIRSLFILNTCNRTEIYAYVADESVLRNLFMECKKIDPELFNQKYYSKTNREALRHLFEVAAGLNSQILGDYEILAQLKQAVAFSKNHNLIGPIMDRTINFALQASKKIKTNTSLSTGTTSVSFAAIEWLKRNADTTGKKMLLVGLGKFGTLIGKNLKHYFKNSNIIVCNRTDEKSIHFANVHSIECGLYQNLAALVNEADIVIVSTQAAEPTVMPEFITDYKSRVFIDLSIPSNVHHCIRHLPQQQMVNVDDISIILNDTIKKRTNEIPAAYKILEETQVEFVGWLGSHSHSPMVKDMKDKLLALTKSTGVCEMADSLEYNFISPQDEYTINKTISRLAVNLKNTNEKGCQFIDAYNHFFSQKISE
jgi:glutamyl-tRNA reductase